MRLAQSRRALIAGSIAVSAAMLTTLAGTGTASATTWTDAKGLSALVTASEAATATGWNNAANPLTTTTYAEAPAPGVKYFEAEIDPTTALTTAQVAPWDSMIVVFTTKAARDAFWVNEIGLGSSQSVVTEADAPYSDTYQRAGIDGIVIGTCKGGATATTTALNACSKKLASVQTAKWLKTSPNPVFYATASITGRLLTATQARAAVMAPAGTKTTVGVTSTRVGPLGGKAAYRTYATTASNLAKYKFAAPVSVSVIQYGRTVDAQAAFAAYLKADAKYTKYNPTYARYTTLRPTTSHGKATTLAITVQRVKSQLVVTATVGNPFNKPTSATLISTSQRMANYEASVLAPLLVKAP